MSHDDFLWNLIQSLSSEEKRMIKKYLQVFRNTKPLQIFVAYQSSAKVYHEDRIFHKSGIRSKNQFRKEKSQLKEHILDFLSIRLKDQRSQWTLKTLHGRALWEKGGYFGKEAFKKLNGVAEESISSYHYAYTLLAWKPLSQVLTSRSVKNLATNKAVEGFYNTAVDNLYHMHHAEKFFFEVGLCVAQSKMVRSNEKEEKLKDLGANKYMHFDYNEFAWPESQVNLLLVKIIYSLTCNDRNELIKNCDYLELLMNSKSLQGHLSLYPDLETAILLVLIMGYQDLRLASKFLLLLERMKTFITKQYPDKLKYAIKWAKWYEMKYSYDLQYSNVNESDAKDILDFLEGVDSQPLATSVAGLKMLAVRVYLKTEQPTKALSITREITTLDGGDFLLRDYKEWGRLLELVCLFEDQRPHLRSENCSGIESIAHSHYLYFSRRPRGYYQYELLLCRFFEKLGKHINTGLTNELVHLKNRISEIEKNDVYGSINKTTTRVFDFPHWIDALLAQSQPH